MLKEQRSAAVFAMRDSELLLLPTLLLDALAAGSTHFALALARVGARRLRHSNRLQSSTKQAHVFVIVPHSIEIDVAYFAMRLVAEFKHAGRTELVWDARASTHAFRWFNAIENPTTTWCTLPTWRLGLDAAMLPASRCDPAAGAGRRRRNALAGDIAEAALARGARVELALLHEQRIETGAATRWLAASSVAQHHHIVDAADLARLARLLTRRSVGLVLSGGGARGFAHLGIIRALREAQVPIDYVGSSSIRSIIAAGVAMGWGDDEMRMRYHQKFRRFEPTERHHPVGCADPRPQGLAAAAAKVWQVIEDLPQPYFS